MEEKENNEEGHQVELEGAESAREYWQRYYNEADKAPAEVSYDGVHWFPAEEKEEKEIEPELLVTKHSVFMQVPQSLMADYAMPPDWFQKMLRGEVSHVNVPTPTQEPKKHRCLWCWLAQRFAKNSHERCEHGNIRCEDCLEETIERYGY